MADMIEPSKKVHIPAPPHPTQRREPLRHSDLNSRTIRKPKNESRPFWRAPAALPAGSGLGLPCNRGDVRGVRLELDYLKAEILFSSTPSGTPSSFSAEPAFRNQRPFGVNLKACAPRCRRTRPIRISRAGLKSRSVSKRRVITMTWLVSSVALWPAAARIPRDPIWR